VAGEPGGQAWFRALRGVRLRRVVVDATVGLAVFLLMGFAPLARLAADREPVAPDKTTVSVEEVDQLHKVRDLPAGLPDGVRAERPEDLRDLASLALGSWGADRLIQLLRSTGSGSSGLNESAVGGSLGFAPYPYRYPPMSRILDQAPAGGRTRAAAALGAALMLLASRRDESGVYPRYPSAGAAAYALLDVARSTGDCAAQLNLLLLVASDDQPRDSVVVSEAKSAASLCPDDPTPGWLLGQFQSQRAAMDTDVEAPGDPVPADAQQQAVATFASLVARFPNSADAWAGFADAHLRAGLRLTSSQPFTARHEIRTAVKDYRRAGLLSGTDESVPGMTRALTALGEPEEAVALLRPSVDDSPVPGPLLEILTEAQEAAHDFAAASETARRLDRLGPAAYPRGPALFPSPRSEDTSSPIGADRLASLTVQLQPAPGGAGGGAVVGDVSFVPVYRQDYSGLVETQADCPSWGWRRDAALSGHAAAALEDWPRERFPFHPARSPDAPWWATCGPYTSDALDARDVLRLEAGLPVSANGNRANTLADERQNMWRWAGELDRAEQVVRSWDRATGSTAALPALRLGEIQFLQKRYNEAAATFGVAARRTRQTHDDDDLGVDEALLDRGAALLAASRGIEGIALLRSVDGDASRGAYYYAHRFPAHYDSEGRFAAVSYHARALMGDGEREAGELFAAMEDYDAAREIVPLLKETGASDYRVERIDNNQAVAELALGRVQAAGDSVDRALRADPMNPAFLMTAAVVADRAGHTVSAASYNARALASDPGAFPAANDLGVQLARLHRYPAAVAALRRAVGANPSYALGWFNLGVVESWMGPSHVLGSQGALARSFELNPALVNRDRELTVDATTYHTGLDLSKPLPPDWSFAQLQRAAPTVSAGLLAVVLLALGLARSIGRSAGVDLAERWLTPATELMARLPVLGRLRAPAWALGVTVLVLSFSAIRHPGLGAQTIAAGAVGVTILVVAAMRARVVMALQAQSTATQESWGPGLVFALATAAVGAAWAPLPVVHHASPKPRRVHAAAPVTLAVLAAVLFVESAWLEVPVTHSWAVAALIMAASTLLPIDPLDGANFGKGGVVACLGVIAGAVLVALGLA
jgi:tetratricopeptide (TPR) repeat protein